MIKIKIERIGDQHKLSFTYNGESFFGYMSADENTLYTTLGENPTKDLLNLCMKSLRDLKMNAIEKEKNKPKILFAS